MIISFEGGEGSGKSTIIKKIKPFLEKNNIDYLITREPGGVPIAEKIRDIILDVNHTNMDIRTEAMLYAAARRQHLAQKVFPELNKGKVVIFDRFIDSSLVYQGYCRGIGIDEVYELNQFATEGIMPNITIYLDVEPEIGLQRVNSGNREVNRLDLESLEFHKKVREGYLLLAKKYSNRYRVIDANQTLDSVYNDVIEVLKNALGIITDTNASNHSHGFTD